MYRCRKQTNKQKVPVYRDFDIQCPQRTTRKVNSELMLGWYRDVHIGKPQPVTSVALFESTL